MPEHDIDFLQTKSVPHVERIFGGRLRGSTEHLEEAISVRDNQIGNWVEPSTPIEQSQTNSLHARG